MGVFKSIQVSSPQTFVLLLFVFGATSLCSASPITYSVNQTVGAGSVTGFIETDGTIGTLSAGNILNWNLVLNDGSAPAFDLLGPLSGSNSVVGIAGSDLSATATELSFNFGGIDGGYALFQSPALFTGSDFWCSVSADTSSSFCPPPAGEAINVSPDSNRFTSVSGTAVIATASSVPEPSYLPIVGLGITLLGLLKAARSNEIV
jgi:hypothetical protein